jgi:hypothetical protein
VLFIDDIRVGTAPAPSGAVNLLVNGGFEDGVLEPWGTYGDVTAEVVQELVGAAVPEPPVEGAFCLYVDVAPGIANFWEAGLQPVGEVFEAGNRYTISAFLKAKEGTLDINFKPELGADPWTGYGEQMITITDEWAEYSVTTPVFTEDVDPASFTFHIGSAQGGFWVDNVRFYEGSYVSPDGTAPEGFNLLTNGGFEDGVLDPWYLYDNTGGGATAEVVTDDVAEGSSVLHVVVPTAGTNFWDVGLSQPGFVFEAEKKYTLSAWFKCGTGTLDVNFKPELAADPWTGYGSEVKTITDEWAEYSVTTPVFAEDTSPGTITFHIGFAASEFWLDGVRFYEGDYVPVE